MDGLTAIKIIRSEEASGQLKRSYVVALTGNARQQQIEEALSYGMDEGEVLPFHACRSRRLTFRPYSLDQTVQDRGSPRKDIRSHRTATRGDYAIGSQMEQPIMKVQMLTTPAFLVQARTQGDPIFPSIGNCSIVI